MLGSNAVFEGPALFQSQQQFRFRIALVAAFALLLAQFGAMAHAYTHVPVAQKSGLQQPVPASHDYCADCLNFAPLLAAAGAPAPMPFTAPPTHTRLEAAKAADLFELTLTLAFRSRAPPVDA
jgi:hypothetical protein